MVQLPDEFVRPYSFAAKAAHLQSANSQRRVGAFHLEGVDVTPTTFVENDILVSSDYPEVVDYLVNELGGTVAPDRPLPPPPPQLARSRPERSDADAATHSVKVTFTDLPEVPNAPHALERIVSQAPQGRLAFSSQMAAAVSAAAASLDIPEGSVGLNRLADLSTALPLTTIRENMRRSIGSDPTQWGAFAGKSRIVDAWQLVDSYRLAGRSPAFTTLAIMDRGFWVDSLGFPMVPTGQSGFDFDSGLLPINASDDSRNIGGRDEKGGWHGANTSSVAAATVDNGRGAAGSGGSVAWPLLMRHDDVDSIMRGIRICAAWGIDVVNMSFGITTDLWSEFWSFPDTDWVNAFQFAANNGVVMIAAAGNDGKKLPDEWIRPATRTPGVITVGALDTDNVQAAGWSNYGSSVAIWAPGTAVPVGPDGDSPRGSTADGTSFSSPLVAGTAAMIRAVAPSMSNTDVGRLLVGTGWNGQGRVTKGLDAYAAVKAALNAQLPDISDAGDTPSSARPLVEIRTGVLAPQTDSFSAAKTDRDSDHWSFSLEDYSTVTVTVNWYDRIAKLYVDLLDSSGQSVTTVEFEGGNTFTISYGDGIVSGLGVLPQGDYILRVKANGLTAYNLEVTYATAPLERDEFEANDSFDDATTLRFVRTPLDIFIGHGPGSFGLTLHQQLVVSPIFPNVVTTVIDSDYFWFHVPKRDGKRIPLMFITSDKPVTATLYDKNRRPLQNHGPKSNIVLQPPEQTDCYLKISGDEQTRYRLGLRMMVDPRIKLADLPTYEVLPPWWANGGPIPFPDPKIHFGIELITQPQEFGTLIGESIAVGATGSASLPIKAELLNRAGEVVAVGEQDSFGRTDIVTAGLEPGMYVVRLTKPDEFAVDKLHLLTPLWTPVE